jgi:hypothetical protein
MFVFEQVKLIDRFHNFMYIKVHNETFDFFIAALIYLHGISVYLYEYTHIFYKFSIVFIQFLTLINICQIF